MWNYNMNVNYNMNMDYKMNVELLHECENTI